ncbi:MAG: DUF2817 domain-containing protein [Candidatus Nanoarchaeia archaeon]|jgi:predicted deacylase|nr:DUF2817 domain-containing protein [Candidatus Nanoarchaeia archaeon]
MKPSFFRQTQYREPDKIELKEIHGYNLSAIQLMQGLGYAIIGRGIRREIEQQRITNALKNLIAIDPNNSQYKLALQEEENKRDFKITHLIGMLPDNYQYKHFGCDIYVFFPKTLSRTRVLIVGGIHGDEPAGPLGLMEFLRQRNSKEILDRLSVSFLPVMNVYGYIHNTRDNEGNKDINRNYDNGSPSKEAQAIKNNKDFIFNLASKGFLTLHEDITKDKFYLYTCGKNRKLFDSLRAVGKKAFGLATGEANDKYPIDNGFVKDVLDDGSFESFLGNNGIIGVTTETPTIEKIDKRIETNRLLVNAFLRHFVL